MTTSRTNPEVGPLLRALGAFLAEGKTDGQLLRDFLACRDEAAFAALVRRHGSMVFGVCRRILGNRNDAEDAFQAVFLVLARKAASLAARPVVGDWLHGVARRTALCARRADARRRATEQNMARPDTQAAEARNDWLPLLDEELGRLPPIYRQAVVLCDLQGRTRKEAARQLGIPEGTVATRLTRARSLLARRLTRRGVVVSGAALAAALAGAVSPGVAGPVIAATARAAVCFAAGRVASGAISARVAVLSEGVLKAMLFGKLKRMTAILMAAGIITLGVGVFGYHLAAGMSSAPGQRETDNQTGLAVSPEVVARLGIRTTAATPRGGNRLPLLHVGTLSYDAERVYTVRNRFPGEVTEIGAIQDGGKARPLCFGDRVKKGQLLAVLWSKTLGERKAAFVDAICKLNVSMEALKRIQKLYDQGVIPAAALTKAQQEVQRDSRETLTAERTLVLWKFSEEDFKDLKAEAKEIAKNPGKRDAAKEAARWARVEIRAPADGTVVEKNAGLGDILEPGAALFKIADLSRLQIRAHPPEEYLSLIRNGLKQGKKLKWQVRFPSEPPNTPPLELNIAQIAPGLDPNQQSPTVIGYLDNPEGKYLVGQFVTVVINPPGKETDKPTPSVQEVAVPLSALVEQGGAAFVLVRPDPKKAVFEARRVLVVRRGSDVVHLRARLNPEEVRQGFQVLLPGEQVVTTGATDLKAVLDDLKTRDKR